MARDFILSIDVGFTSHPKTQRFCRLMGEALAFGYLIQLWSWAIEAAPLGELVGQEPADIEWATGYRGGDGRCYAALVKAGFIDADATGAPVSLHNWMRPGHTGFAIQQMESERKRWRRSKGIPEYSARKPSGVSVEATRETTGTQPPSRFTVHGSEETLPARDPGATEHETAKEIAPHEVMALWGKARNEEFGGHPFDVNGLGIKPEAAREAADLINATVGGRPHVEPSMRKFWRAVKAGKFRESREMARKPAFAFGCWLKNDFIGDFEEATGAMPAIPAFQPGRSTASRGPPAANQPDRSRPRAYVPGET